jgi:hypothetical protein
MTDMKIGNNTALAQCDAAVDRIDVGAGTAVLRIYSGTKAADPSVSPAGTLLVEFALPNPAFGNAAVSGANAVATAAAITAVTAAAGAPTNATWGRVINRNGEVIFDGDVSNNAGAGDIKMSNISVTAGQDASVTSWTFSQPKGW